MDKDYINNRLRMEKEKNLKDQYKNNSKDRLSKITKKKMQTIMVGSISALEKHFGFLWGHDSDKELSQDELDIKDLFDKVRAEIFDNGNNQIRNFETELEQYEIEWLRYHLDLPVKPEGPNGRK